MQRNKIQHLFFDLDRTLWDFETNSKKALEIIYREHNLSDFFSNFLLFHKHYKMVNAPLWEIYYKGEITKEELNFERFFQTIGSKKQMCKQISESYLELSACQTTVFDNTHKVLEILKERGYTLHIITNGFRNIQYKKLENSKLSPYFTTITTSEDSTYHKPHPKAFSFALEKAKATKEHSVMIGDDLVADIEGAIKSGLFTVYFNSIQNNTPHNANYEISNLESLLRIFS